MGGFIVKLTSVEPFVGTPEIDREREIATAEVSEFSDVVQPISNLNDQRSEMGASDDETLGDGLLRLSEFLNKETKKRSKNGPKSKISVGIARYKYSQVFKDSQANLASHLDTAA